MHAPCIVLNNRGQAEAVVQSPKREARLAPLAQELHVACRIMLKEQKVARQPDSRRHWISELDTETSTRDDGLEIGIPEDGEEIQSIWKQEKV